MISFLRRSLALWLGGGALFAILIGSGVTAYYWHFDAQVAAVASAYKTPQEENIFVRFDMEVFDIIVREYWQKVEEKDLAEVFRLALAKAHGEEVPLPTRDRSGAAQMLHSALTNTSPQKQKSLAVDVSVIVLANLAPQGRSGLLSQADEQAFRDIANNIDRSNNLYEALSVAASSTVAEVEKAFQEKKAELEESTAPEAKEQLAKAEHARTVLTDSATKTLYDETKIEPSLMSRIVGGKTLYINLSQVTPATFSEFVNVLLKTGGDPNLSGLILDMRGNIGGSLDFTKYLLALFVGPNQYAFDLFRKGEQHVERTPAIAPLPSLQKLEVAVLVDEMTQSTAELTAAVFKRQRIATIVGARTRGWGSVENTYPVQSVISDGERHSVLLVNSITLREDNEPIEGRGIDPHVNVAATDWRKQLSRLIHTVSLQKAVEEVIR